MKRPEDHRRRQDVERPCTPERGHHGRWGRSCAGAQAGVSSSSKVVAPASGGFAIVARSSSMPRSIEAQPVLQSSTSGPGGAAHPAWPSGGNWRQRIAIPRPVLMMDGCCAVQGYTGAAADLRLLTVELDRDPFGPSAPERSGGLGAFWPPSVPVRCCADAVFSLAWPHPVSSFFLRTQRRPLGQSRRRPACDRREETPWSWARRSFTPLPHLVASPARRIDRV